MELLAKIILKTNYNNWVLDCVYIFFMSFWKMIVEKSGQELKYRNRIKFHFSIKPISFHQSAANKQRFKEHNKMCRLLVTIK